MNETDWCSASLSCFFQSTCFQCEAWSNLPCFHSCSYCVDFNSILPHSVIFFWFEEGCDFGSGVERFVLKMRSLVGLEAFWVCWISRISFAKVVKGKLKCRKSNWSDCKIEWSPKYIYIYQVIERIQSEWGCSEGPASKLNRTFAGWNG